MKKLILSFSLLMTLSLGFQSYACTNYLITKGASVDGSTMISYAADSHVLYGELYHWPATKYKKGTMLKVYDWDTGKYLGEIPQAMETYNVIGNMNEHQVAIGETTYGGRSELASQPGAIMDYGSLIYIALQRSKNAREAIKTISSLMDLYGYCSVGESFSIADKDEVWIMEIIGKGRNYKITNQSLKELTKLGLSTTELKKIKKIKNKLYTIEKDFKNKLISLFSKDFIKKNYKNIKTAAKNTLRGALWVARRIPDGYVSGHANQARISTFEYQTENKWDDPNTDTFNEKNVISYAKEKGWYKGNDKYFSFSETYAPVDFGGARFCEIRVWTMFNKVVDGMDKYWDYAKGHIKHDKQFEDGRFNPNNYATNRMPLWVKPKKKVSLHDMMMFMRDHLEGTELDMSKDIGAGPFGNPYRWRGLIWKVDGVSYCNERATATQQTGFSFVTQSRNWLPDEIGGIFWFGVDDAASSVYTPMYSSITEVPETFKVGNGKIMEWSDNSAFWIFNQVSNFTYTRYEPIHADLEKVQSEFEKEFIELTPIIDKAALKLHEENPQLAVNYLTRYSVGQGDRLTYSWKKLYQFLFMKYMDGNIKTKRPLPSNHKYITPDVKQPGYGEEWYRKIVETTGDQFKVIGAVGH
jgi:dipeptidase